MLPHVLVSRETSLVKEVADRLRKRSGPLQERCRRPDRGYACIRVRPGWKASPRLWNPKTDFAASGANARTEYIKLSLSFEICIGGIAGIAGRTYPRQTNGGSTPRTADLD